jgi:DNA-binding XRE family transcriptional regulator
MVQAVLSSTETNMPALRSKSVPDAAIARNMIIAREALGLSSDEMAKRLGISRQSYIAWEQGKRHRWTDMFTRLIYVAQLPVSTDFLLLGRGDPLVPAAVHEAALLRHRIYPKTP